MDEWRQRSGFENGVHVHFECEAFQVGVEKRYFGCLGPSSKLLSADTELQEYLSRIRDAGVKLLACKKCSDMYGVSDNLRRLGIEVKYMGKPLTEYLRNYNYRVITI